ncbi:energy-coupling factor transporter transmembrane component T family protein [Nocardioides rotundus]|uniref:energy-coupling factor transporter transmembrane component T family protein n=1 Tax=Nocardioides rotundus TaxID=1774216 RepID=UPI001CC17249|nr:energy-coupling factor transporter transmembrane protein EcfT [Nocardioides rotundus]
MMHASLYRPGNSVLHRLPAGLKLSILLAAGGCSILVQTPTQTTTALGCVLLGYVVARVPARAVLQSLRPLVWVILALGLFQALIMGWPRAFVIVGVIVALVLLANLVTLTTRTSDLVDVVVRLSRRVRFLGIHPESIGLMLSLAIRAVPLVAELAARVREAQQARGQTISPRASAVPLILGTLRRADEIGDALAARGYDD